MRDERKEKAQDLYLKLDEANKEYTRNIATIIRAIPLESQKLIQPKPEIDDMREYLREKARRFFRKHYLTTPTENDMLEMMEEILTQIVRDVRGNRASNDG